MVEHEIIYKVVEHEIIYKVVEHDVIMQFCCLTENLDQISFFITSNVISYCSHLTFC